MEISKRQLQENYNPSDFNNIPELSQIGTEEQYSAYLDTIFPSSKINQIMYHKTSAEKFDEFKVSRLGGVYFSFFDVPTRAGFIGKMIAKLTKERMVLAKVNVINPFIINRNNYKDIEKKTGGATQSVTELGKKYDLSGYDSILGYPNPLYDKGELDKFPQINFIEGRRKDLIELAVFNPKNIHILGSKQDIEGFRNFVNNTDMEITKRQLQENLNNVIYTAVFFNTNEVVSKYKQIHPNLYSHHSTIEFKPTDISNLPIGEEINIKVIGRLTNDKVDVLLVKNPLSKNKFPHITLSTAEGIKPFQSNTEIENNQDKIKPINDNLIGIVGYFDGSEKTQLEEMEITKRQLQDEEVTAYHGGPHSFDKFSTQYMGTGEGNQSFGWGLYFTDLEDIAMNYAFKLSKLSAMDKIFKELKMDDMSFRTREIMYEYSPDHARGEWLIEALDNNYYEEFRKEELNQLRKFAEYKIKKGNKLGLEGYIYKVSLHKGKTPEQYTWLEWDKPVPEKVMNTLGKKLIHNGNFLKDLFDNSREYEKTDGTKVKGLYPDGLMFYKRISQILGGDKEASLFLLRAGIDGIKYPADSLSRGATSYNTSGFNYVVFDENAVNIEKQTQLEGMEISKKELIQNKKLKEDAEDVNFMGEITKGELEEAKKARTKLRKKKKADRCTRIAKSKYDVWPSAYSSAAVVRCRQGKIWKGLKEEEELDIQEPEYALIEITKALAFMDDKYTFQLIPKLKLNNRLIDIKKGASGTKQISKDNIKVLKTGNKKELEKELEIRRKKQLNEKWSEKYKGSIDCNNPKGFSQKAHCKGKLKEEDEYAIGGVEQLEKKLLDKYKGLKTLFLSASNGVLSIDMIEVNPNERKKGVGSNVMNDIIEYADANNMEIQLNPALKDERKGTTSRNRLVRFYKNFGFIENTGRNIDYRKKSGSMYRLPKSVKQLKEEYSNVGVGENVEGTAKALADIAKKNGITTPDDFGNASGGALMEIISTADLMDWDDMSKSDRDALIKTIPNHFKKLDDILSVSAAPKDLLNLLSEIKNNFIDGKYDDVKKKTSQLKKEMDAWGKKLNPNMTVSDGAGVRNVAEAYHKAKADGSNPELVKAVENALKEQSQAGTTLNEKTDFSKEKEQGLHGWFARQGGKGKSKGWVDCNTCRDGKCKSCGRKEGESRAKYPACRPTPSACKTKGKGKSWGKKSTNEDVLNEQSKQDIERELKLNEIKSLFKRHIGKL